ncbi:MAG TPA: CRTAC1 family protein, partial [Chitinophagaceae bacterium]|nr:CRTAC1 family protein [Chitinophagaceae bacterium]
FFERDYLYINQKNGTFKESLESYMQHTSLASMGADMGDINNDGYTDIFTTDMLPDDDYRLKTTSLFDNIDVYRIKEAAGFYHQYMQNTLQLNNKNNTFSDIAYYSGVAASDWSWGGIMFDADNDGFTDLYVCNGIFHDVTNQDFIDFFANDVIQKMVLGGKKEDVDQIIAKMPSYPIPNKAFRNGGNLKFTDEGTAWGFEKPSFSNGAAYGDLDNDGDLDLVVNNVNEQAFVYKNNSREVQKNNFIGFTLKGKGPNDFAIGSTIKIFQGTQILSRELMPSRGFQSSVDYKVLIGLGKGSADSAYIIWPDSSITKMLKPAINRIHSLAQNNAQMLPAIPTAAPRPLLQQQPTWGFEKHKEDDYIDFYYERGLPMMLSHEGPKAAHGDVNGDGLEDIYISGASSEAGQLYLQTAMGFKKKDQPAFAPNTGIEETAALFFDCDGDGDLDLFVGAGGNHHAVNSFQMQNRLFKNNGAGVFTLTSGELPATGMNTSVALADDFDNDGDADLFVGSRSIPQAYGATPPSFVFLNDGRGHFQNMDLSKSSLSNAGLVTGAVLANVAGDAKKELIVVGEWMAPRVYSYSNNAFTEVKTNVSGMDGLWQSVTAADLDNDGDDDLVLGNLGENAYLRPTDTAPIKMWIADYDNNGTVEKLLTRTVHGKDMPVFLKRDVTEQIASLRKQNLKYEAYATKSVQDLFPEAIVTKNAAKTVRYNSSCILFNEGAGTFTVQKLPPQAQFSSINAIHCTDVNGDGKKDILAGGNNFEFQPQFSRLDASFGVVLMNNGNRNFAFVSPGASGLSLRGQVRDIIEVPVKKEPHLLILQNDDFPVWFQKPGLVSNNFKTP